MTNSLLKLLRRVEREGQNPTDAYMIPAITIIAAVSLYIATFFFVAEQQEPACQTKYYCQNKEAFFHVRQA